MSVEGFYSHISTQVNHTDLHIVSRVLTFSGHTQGAQYQAYYIWKLQRLFSTLNIQKRLERNVQLEHSQEKNHEIAGKENNGKYMLIRLEFSYVYGDVAIC